MLQRTPVLVVIAASLVVAACAETTEIVAPPTAQRPHVEGELEEPVGESLRPPVRRAPPEFEDTDPSAVRLFYDVLAPYGTWSDDPRFGFVWRPSKASVGESFVPYATHGRWTWRDYEGQDEHVWVSDLPWGWVTFHYGRWTYAADRGWTWIPGRRYAGAWVDWCVPADPSAPATLVGWGPTPPSHVFRISPGPYVSRSRMSARLAIEDAIITSHAYVAFATPYTYARAQDLFAPDLASHLLVGPATLAVAHAAQPSSAPSPERLGLRRADVPAPPLMDRGLQQAWALATPSSAIAVGAGPELGAAPRLRTWVAGGPRWVAYSR
jgi:hypothetical protein